MLIETERSLMIRCPICGKLELNQISLFQFSGDGSFQVSCQCGFNLLTAYTDNYRDFHFQIPCQSCEEVHHLSLSRQQLWKHSFTVLRCYNTGKELGYLGTFDGFNNNLGSLQEELLSFNQDDDFDDYFSNMPVMFEVLKHLNHLVEEDKLFCRCGNKQIDLKIFPEKLELHCPVCHSLHLIYAETKDDLRLVQKADVIAMVEKGFTSFDAGNVQPI